MWLSRYNNAIRNLTIDIYKEAVVDFDNNGNVEIRPIVNIYISFIL